MSLPQSTLYGSRGIPLHHPRESSGPAIRIDLSQFQLGVGLTPCSLDTLGIVPARSLIKGKFGSLSSLVNPRSYSRSTFKQHYPPSSASSHSQPVIIRGIIPGSPVAVTRNLHEGMHAALVLKARRHLDGSALNCISLHGVCLRWSLLSSWLIVEGKTFMHAAIGCSCLTINVNIIMNPRSCNQAAGS